MASDAVSPVERLYNEFYNQPDLTAAKQAAQSIFHDPEPFISQYAALRSAFPDWQMTRELTLRTGSYVAVRWTARGTQLGVFTLPQVTIPPTGRFVEVLGISIYHLSRGRIVSSVWAGNGLDMLSQLGVRFEPPSSASSPPPMPRPRTPRAPRPPRTRHAR